MMRHWFESLTCGAIVGTSHDGFLTLCSQQYGHSSPCDVAEIPLTDDTRITRERFRELAREAWSL